MSLPVRLAGKGLWVLQLPSIVNLGCSNDNAVFLLWQYFHVSTAQLTSHMRSMPLPFFESVRGAANTSCSCFWSSAIAMS